MKQLGRALAIQLHYDPRRVQLSTRQRVLDTPLDQLLVDARAVRDRQFGSRVTYSPKVFIPLTMLCRDKCGYCTFAQPPARLENPYLSADQVLAIAKQGAKSGCHEALFTLGERPELRYDVAAEWLKAKYVISEWRPVNLKEGVLLKNEIQFKDGSARKIDQPTNNDAVN